MNKRKFLEKFVALSSASLVVAGCATTQNSHRLGAIKKTNTSQNINVTKSHPSPPVVKPIIKDDQPVAVYGPPPPVVVRPTPKEEIPVPAVAVYGPPPVR
ncbi:hypothetical protein MNB_SV-14-745 [hydrothermal vent metagenome]|uniref:Uncharacterized protein n=1 Tax=hydrothermal vent metagenome TaxID=652676 RepID=A0A1W1CBS5_9ZZZZ